MTSRSWLGSWLATAAPLLLLISSATARSHQPSPSLPITAPLASNLSVTLDLTGPFAYVSQPIPGNFLGLSLEWCNPLHLIGPNVSNPHKSFYNIFPFLSTRGAQGPTIRAGGSSSDRSWYNPTGRPIPPWKDFVANITDDVYVALEAVSRTFNSSIIAGVSFRYAFNDTIFAPEVEAMARVLGREPWQQGRWTIEIGNEQDIIAGCGTNPYEDYRPCGWGWRNFTVEYDWELAAIQKLLPTGLPAKLFQGGAFCCPSFESMMAEWAIPRADRFATLSFHRYIWNGCGDNPTLDQFLSDYAGLAGLEAPLERNITLPNSVARIRASTDPPLAVRLGEGNSVGCQGMGGITDTFAQVVWLLDYCMALSSFNVSGMDFYIGWTEPQQFQATPFVYLHDTVDEVTVRPMMMGMWMWTFVTWNHARIVEHARVSSSPLVKSWTLLDADRNVVVLVIRKDRNGTDPVSISVTIDVPDTAEQYPANAVTVSAPSITAYTGITLAGWTWEGTSDGLPRKVGGGDGIDSVSVEAVAERRQTADGLIAKQLTYTFSLNPAAAVAIVIPTSAAHVNSSWERRVRTILRTSPSPTTHSTTPLSQSSPSSCPPIPWTAASAPVVQRLSSSDWSLRNANASISVHANCTVPGSVFLNLNSAGVLPDLFYRFNPITYQWVSDEASWTYTRTFPVLPRILSAARAELVLHGVDTIANVSINGHFLGTTINQFRRWTFDVTGLLTADSVVEVALLNPHKYSAGMRAREPYSFYANGDAAFLRKTASDFGWDWGPAFVNLGLWQDVDLRGYDDAVMVDMLVTQAFWEDSSPALRSRWGLKAKGDVLVNVTAYLRTGSAAVDGQLRVEIPSALLNPVVTSVKLPATPATASGDHVTAVSSLVVVPAGAYELWWPNGYGAHPLYNVTATFVSAGGEASAMTRRVGFRRTFIRRVPIEGQPGRTMFFEVNGVKLFNKGSNLVPATPFHVQESELQRRTLQGAVDAHQSIIRVWGGGVYETDDTYDFADENGLMMWQEAIFANSLYPVFPDFLDNVREEVTQQVRRLASHPSLSVLCGNNEVEGDVLTNGGSDGVNHDHALVDYNELFTNTIRDAVVREVGLYEDGTPHVDYIMSSPANGPASLVPFTWQWGASRDLSMGDLHYYNYDVDCSVPSNFPQPRHLTEWGWQSYPSFLTWQAVTDADDWQLASPLMQNRQHHPDGNEQQLRQIQRHFHVPNASDPRQQFDDYCYVSQSVAALCYGTLMAYYRTLRNQPPAYTAGAMYWQLADQWQAPTWSSIEVRGRWKQNHFAVRRAFAPISFTGHINATRAGDALLGYLVTDVQMAVRAAWTVEVRSWQDGAVLRSVNGTATVQPAYSLLVINDTVSSVLDDACDRLACFLRLSAVVSSDECLDAALEVETFLFLAPLANVSLQEPHIKVTATSASLSPPASRATSWDHCAPLRSGPVLGDHVGGGLDVPLAGNVSAVTVLVSAQAVAAYVWLESAVEGRWTDNSFTLLPAMGRTVQFVGYNAFDAQAFLSTLQVRSIRDTYTRDTKAAKSVRDS